VVESGRSGLLVPPGDADAIARAVESLVADPGRRQELGREAHRRARSLFSADVIVTKYEELYRRVCAAPETA
jgi:glycosyltransferase involved in cell wall biosynthesis